MKFKDWLRLPLLIRRVTGRDAFRWMTGIAIVLATGIFFSWRYWGELHGDQESLSTTVRNVGVVIGGVIAILLAVWRGTVADRQAKAGQRQSETAQQGLSNERYQKGAEMIGSGVLSVRLGGVYALQRLAEEHPKQYHVQIMRLFCAFARHPTEDSEEKTKQVGQPDSETKPLPRPDIQAIMEAIRDRREAAVALEKQDGFKWNLVSVNLSGSHLANIDFSLGAALESEPIRRGPHSGRHVRCGSQWSKPIQRKPRECKPESCAP